MGLRRGMHDGAVQVAGDDGATGAGYRILDGDAGSNLFDRNRNRRPPVDGSVFSNENDLARSICSGHGGDYTARSAISQSAI